jgi:hypothetical protein
LYFFNGSINQGSQLYWIDDSSDVQNGKWETYNTLERKYRDQVTNEADFFVKDDWKISKSLTLNLAALGILRRALHRLGLYDRSARTGARTFWRGRTVLGSTNPFDKWLTLRQYLSQRLWPSGSLQCNDGPGQRSGRNSRVELRSQPDYHRGVCGTEQPESNKTVYPNDFNNFGPAVGFAWQPPSERKARPPFGRYQMTFGGAGRGGSGAESFLGGAPGATSNATIDFTALGNPYLNLNNVSTIVPIKPTNPALPGGTLGALTARLRHLHGVRPELHDSLH